MTADSLTGELPDGVRLGAVTLSVADAERSMTFYRDLVGLRELSRAGSLVTLGAGANPVLHLAETAGAQPAPARSTGLYHTAILFPDRAALARVVRHIAQNDYAFSGASDHLVSEAFYLDDPDGHGVELYRDRPSTDWPRRGDTIEMASLPLDVPDLLREATRDFDGAPEGTCIGHVHLKVHDLAQAEAFYTNVVGFAVTARYGDSATFLAAGGYHHHLGANIWHSRGAPPVPDGHVRLREIIIEVPGPADVDGFARRAERAGVAVTRDGARVTVRDPWNHSIVVTTG